MSFMGDVLGGGQNQLDYQEGFIGMLLAIIAADGHIDSNEVVDFHAAIKKTNLLKNLDPRLLSRKIENTIRILNGQGLEGLVQESAKALTSESLRKGTFAYACDMVFSDGNVDPMEVRVMDRIKFLLQIDDQFAQEVGEVFKAKASV